MIRVYGVEDDPKQAIENGTWFNRPILETLERLGLRSAEVWAAGEAPTLWNAALFPVTTPDEAWACARWMMGYASGYSAERWRAARRLSLAESAQCADGKALAEARNHRLQGIWQETAVELAESGADLRPLLANLPGLAPAAAAGRSLRTHADELRKGGPENLTLAASHLMQAARLLGPRRIRAGGRSGGGRGLHLHSGCGARRGCRRCGAGAVSLAVRTRSRLRAAAHRSGRRMVRHPAVLFRLGRHGAQLRAGDRREYPIETEIRRIAEPVIRCYADGQGSDGRISQRRGVAGALRAGVGLLHSARGVATAWHSGEGRSRWKRRWPSWAAGWRSDARCSCRSARVWVPAAFWPQR